MPRPKWGVELWQFVNDTIIDEKFDYPMDGSADEIHAELEVAISNILCKHFGHEIIDDSCGIPEHRYCVYCGRSETSINNNPA